MKNKIRWPFLILSLIFLMSMLSACSLDSIKKFLPDKDSEPSDTTTSENITTTTTSPTTTGLKEESTTTKENLEIKTDNKSDNKPQPTKSIKLIADMNDEELADYLIDQVEEIRENVEIYGMSFLVTGEMTEMENAEYCRDIWLGTDQGESFTREILYTVSPFGIIYEFNVLENYWFYLSPGGITKMYLIKAGDMTGDQANLYLDEVQWNEGGSLEDGLFLSNDNLEWVPYTAGLWTDCYIWGYIEDVGMERFKVSLDIFWHELTTNRGDDSILLADVYTDGNEIIYMAEIYMP